MPKTHLESIKVKRQQLSKQVAQQIQDSIVQGRLQSGDKLPPERELASQLQVSRTVIREALKLLEDRGLISINVGDGTYVSKVEPEAVSRSISLYVQQRRTSYAHLADVRQMIEVEIAGMAALRATPKDIANLEQSVHDAEQTVDSLDDFVQADMRFHRLLAEASQNPLLPMLLDPIRELLRDLSRRASSLLGAQQDALKHHKRILACVKEKDHEAARQAMRDHLASAQRWGELASQQVEGET